MRNKGLVPLAAIVLAGVGFVGFGLGMLIGLVNLNITITGEINYNYVSDTSGLLLRNLFNVEQPSGRTMDRALAEWIKTQPHDTSAPGEIQNAVFIMRAKGNNMLKTEPGDWRCFDFLLAEAQGIKIVPKDNPSIDIDDSCEGSRGSYSLLATPYHPNKENSELLVLLRNQASDEN